MTGTLGFLTGMIVAAGALGSVAGGGGAFYRPYARSDVDFIYNLLFCDDPQLFAGRDKPTGAIATILSKTASDEEIRKVADDTSAESRLRVLAYNRLRAAKVSVPKGRLLGVIIEMPLGGGLDVLATFSDGRIRYINQTGKMTIVETPTPAMAARQAPLFEAAAAAIAKIGPWDKARRPPPKLGSVRLTFLVSDGLYFGEGPVSAIAKDPVGGPVLAAGGQLLGIIVDASTKH